MIAHCSCFMNYRNIFNSLKERAWIGLTDEAYEGEWRWLNDEIALPNQTPWNKGEPNNYQNNEDCAQLNDKSPVLNDSRCSIILPGVCEIDESKLFCGNCVEGKSNKNFQCLNQIFFKAYFAFLFKCKLILFKPIKYISELHNRIFDWLLIETL